MKSANVFSSSSHSFFFLYVWKERKKIIAYQDIFRLLNRHLANMVVQVCYLSIKEAEARGLLWGHGCLGLWSELKTNFVYAARPCLRKTKQKTSKIKLSRLFEADPRSPPTHSHKYSIQTQLGSKTLTRSQRLAKLTGLLPCWHSCGVPGFCGDRKICLDAEEETWAYLSVWNIKSAST